MQHTSYLEVTRRWICLMLSLRLASTIVTQSMQRRRRRSLTSCNECSMLPPVWSRKFDRGLTSLLHDELHWLDVPERVTYKMGVTMYRCLHGQAPLYLADHFTTSSNVTSRLRLRSANRHQLIVSRCRLNTYGRRSGTRCLTSSKIRRAVLTVLSSFLRQSCLGFANVTSALEVFKMLCAIL